MSAYDHDAVPKRARRRTGGPCDAERAYWPKFTLEEVARHKSLKDGWIVVHERVFDITTFAITHPGFHNAGQVSTALAITRNLGEDCTDEFVATTAPRRGRSSTTSRSASWSATATRRARRM